jgi:hypothetical protein
MIFFYLFINKKSFIPGLLPLRLINNRELLIITLLILGSVIRIYTSALGNVVFPGDDIKFHTMLVEVISLTLDPFVHQIAAYVPGFHIIIAFFSLLTGGLPTKTLTIFACFSYGLLGLGFYSLMSSLTKDYLASFLTALTVLFINGEIALISLWGGITLLFTLYLVTSMLAFLYHSPSKLKAFYYLIAGLALSMALITNPAPAVIALCFLTPLIVRKILTKRVSDIMLNKVFRSYINSGIPFFATVFSYLFLLLPLVIPAITSVIGVMPSNILNPPLRTEIYTYGSDWFTLENFFNQVAINHGHVIAASLLISIPLFISIVIRYYRTLTNNLKMSLYQYSVAFSWIMILIIFGINNPQGLFYVEFPLYDLFIPSRMFSLLLIPLSILVGLSFRQLFNILKSLRGISKKSSQVFLILIFIQIVAMFFVVGYDDVKRNYRTERSGNDRIPITTDDLECFKWIRNFTKVGEIILVETSDAGQYIPAFCHRVVVYPFTLIQFDPDYSTLKEYLYTDPESLDAHDLLQQFNITYIFIGSKPSRQPFATFNASSFMNSLDYQITYNSGNAYVLKVIQD